MTTTPGQALVDVFVREQVDVVFGLPGGHILGIYDALYDAPQIRHILARHEHAAASMAAGYAQLTGKPGICLVTAGPGATNVVTAVAEAYIGAMPMIIIGGRASTAATHRGAQQEISTDKVFAPITKWSVRVDRADQIAPLVSRAFVIARTGKPGPVYIDVPRDLFDATLDEVDYQPTVLPPASLPATAQVDAAVEALIAATSPILIAGGGTRASGAFQELRELAELLGAPVLTSLSGRGSFPDDHPLSAGGLGVHRNQVSKALLGSADVILGLGTRFEEMETNWKPGSVPSAGSTYIQVDLDATEFGRSIPVQIAILGDVGETLRQLIAGIAGRRPETPDGTRFDETERVMKLVSQIAEIELEADRQAAEDTVPMRPLSVVRTARRVFPRNTTVAIDVGCLAECIGGSFPFFKVYEPRSVIAPSSFYGMGFSSAAVPAAKVVYPDRPALCFVGDGSFQMAIHVLPVAAEHKLGVTWCVLNDGALGSIRDAQHFQFQDRFIDTTFDVRLNYALIAEASGCLGITVRETGEIESALLQALEANHRGVPAVLDFEVAPDRLLQAREQFNLFEPGAARPLI